MNELFMIMLMFMNFIVVKIVILMFVFNGNFKYQNFLRFLECCYGFNRGGWVFIKNLLIKEFVFLFIGDNGFIFNFMRRYINKVYVKNMVDWIYF